MTRPGSPLFPPLFRVGKSPFALCALTLIAGLAACSSAPPLFLSDGRPTVQVQCAASGDHDSCTQQARARCDGAGFDAVAHSSDGDTYTLVFACRKPK
ncbi:hypothetical protein [Paraburkholderia mimosarum]|uniref:hypothetical protein n=1 Tax=Paraburkholderia mimosarum TaxID=312026 RepID=UPI0006848F38|nr:hypothetical protein [Paraburkholderia mimosarum]